MRSPAISPTRTGSVRNASSDRGEQHIAVLGKTGSGKTFAVKGIVEHLLERGRRVGIVDPTGAWWGLRSARATARARASRSWCSAATTATCRCRRSAALRSRAC
jgi:molybdopterin-guanine dinucleotide biosynthesis protein